MLKFVRGQEGCMKVERIKIIFDLEKQHQCNNVIKELTTVDNKHVNTNNDILGKMCKFYEALYTSKYVDE